MAATNHRVKGHVIIYRIACDDMTYIGQTVKGEERREGHLNSLARGNHGNRHVQRVYDNQGEIVFEPIISLWHHRFEELTEGELKAALDVLEVETIDEYRKAGHTILNIDAGGSAGSRERLEERRLEREKEAEQSSIRAAETVARNAQRQADLEESGKRADSAADARKVEWFAYLVKAGSRTQEQADIELAEYRAEVAREKDERLVERAQRAAEYQSRRAQYLADADADLKARRVRTKTVPGQGSLFDVE